ncbi:MAG: GntR family transcriptional regulator [Terriglobia bacterium]
MPENDRRPPPQAAEEPGESPAAPGHRSNLRKCFEEIRELIVHGRLSPGSRIMEGDLASRLGVSRTPVRSALHMLHKEGYIIASSESTRKVRLTVAPLTKEDANELYPIVGRLEGLAARSTAALDPAARAGVAQKLKRINDDLRGLAEAGRSDPNAIFELDMNFHQTIVDAGAGSRLRALHSGIKPQTERYWRLYASSILDQLGTSVAEHLAIVGAIEHGDPEAAERAVQLNWENGAERLSRVIERHGERGSW